MFEVRVHGRGSQGVVTAAELLSVAAFREVAIDSVVAAIRDRFAGDVAFGNVAAARAAFEFVRQEMEELTDAQAD